MSFASALINKFKNKKIDESQFILGIDLGDSTSSICYFDAYRNTPEIVDISGGYGKANVPTTVQYIPETKEWVFGEYALLNTGAGNDIVFKGIVDKLGTKTYVEIGDKLEPVVNILSIYLKELLLSCRNINPKADIVGIVVSVPSYMPEEARDELIKAFAIIGYDKKLLDFVTDKECIIANHYFGKRVENENVLILDFGGRQLRGGIYSIEPSGDEVNIKTLSYYFDESCGTNTVDSRIYERFRQFYAEGMDINVNSISESVAEQIDIFAYQHKDSIFQKNISQKGVRLYYNFAYPPFYKVFHKEDGEEIIAPFKRKFKKFIEDLVAANVEQDSHLELSDISTVLCTGGGFEMLWARQAVEDMLPDSNIFQYKNSKAIGACGASIIAAGKLGVINERVFITEDRLKLNSDIGVNIMKDNKPRFLPIIEKNSFWWQNNKQVRLIINESVDGSLSLDILKRTKSGEVLPIGKVELSGLPKRPKGVTELSLRLEYINRNAIKASICDYGFGEFFPKSDAENEVIVKL